MRVLECAYLRTDKYLQGAVPCCGEQACSSLFAGSLKQQHGSPLTNVRVHKITNHTASAGPVPISKRTLLEKSFNA